MNKNLLAFLFTCLVVANGFAQQQPPKVYGTVNINNATRMAETEVSLKEWMGFIVNNDFDASLFPDSTNISTSAKLLFNDLRKGKDFAWVKIIDNERREFGKKGVRATNDFKKLADADANYFSIDLPVTGITFEQAQKFCKWKEDVINEFQKIKVTVSLPPVEIYKRVITNMDTLTKNCDCFPLNCSTAKLKTAVKDKRSMTQSKGLESVNSYFPTSLGLYNIEGNAAEMTSTFGIAMGGSFRQTARESYNDRSQKYDKAEDWLGFRYIVTAK